MSTPYLTWLDALVWWQMNHGLHLRRDWPEICRQMHSRAKWRHRIAKPNRKKAQRRKKRRGWR